MHSLIHLRNLAPPSLAIAAIALAGCAGTAGVTYPTYETPGAVAPPYVEGHYDRAEPGYPGQPVYAPGQVGYGQQPYAPDDYLYYPSAEVYFSPTRGEYLYREGNQWVHRREPPRGFDRRAQASRYHGDPEHRDDRLQSTNPRDWRRYDRDRDYDRDHDDTDNR